MLPNFLIVGAARSGTTTLYRYMQEHDDIYLPASKRPEPHFFFRKSAYERGIDWYEETFFSAYQGEKAVGEASTSYLFGPQTPKLIHKHIPSCRFIVLLRNPVERAFSSYWHTVKAGLETLPFDEAIRLEDERTAALLGSDLQETMPYSYIGRGLYALQLQRWFQVFSRDQFCIQLFDDFIEDPVSCLDKIGAFLSIDPSGFHVQKMFDENRSTPENEGISEHSREYLKGRFASDIRDLETMLGRDLSLWEL